MSAEAIPVEILELIFIKLKGKEVTACRAVCRRWRDVMDDIWKRYCWRDFCNQKMARAKTVSNLSYCELYKSLSLWSKVEEAQENCPTPPVDYILGFKVLTNNTLAVCMTGFQSKWYKSGMPCTIIEYYDLQTMQLISRDRYNFTCTGKYDENDKLIVLIYCMDSSICVITKSNKKESFIGNCDMTWNGTFILLDTDVYFRKDQEVMCVARLKVVDGEETIETEELTFFFDDWVVAFARARDKGVNILTGDGKIYCHRDKDIEICYQIENRSQNIINKLWEFGFHWSSTRICQWLWYFSDEKFKIKKPDDAQFLLPHTHNHILLLGMQDCSVHVYKQPYNEDGKLQLLKVRPNRIIYLPKRGRKDIEQLDVVEIMNGHRIIVKYACRLFFIDLLHKQ